MIKNSMAGSLESNDVLIELFANEKGRIIELESVVKKQFNDAILQTVNILLDEYGLENIKVVINDKGALDYTIKARLKTAILRGMNQ